MSSVPSDPEVTQFHRPVADAMTHFIGRGAEVALEHSQRKIAAILAADVVGFSRLTGVDEDRTLSRLRALRSD